MGYTHWKKPVAVEGLYVGAKGSEKKIADTAGIYAGTGTEFLISERQHVLNFVFGNASAAEAVYLAVPVTGNIVSVYNTSTTTTLTLSYSVKIGSAGTEVVTAGFASPGTIGVVQSGTIASAGVTVGTYLGCTRAASGTTGASTCSIVITKTA